MSEQLQGLMEWQREIGLDSSNLLSVAFGGHPLAPETSEVLRTVRDHLSSVLDRIEKAKVAKPPVEAPKKGKRK